MGPLRAFSRPSHAAGPGQFASSASPYSPAQRYSAQHRSCCTHSALSLPPGTPFPNLYSSVYSSDALRTTLAPSDTQTTPPDSLQPCLIRIKNRLVPPGEKPEQSRYYHSTQQGGIEEKEKGEGEGEGKKEGGKGEKEGGKGEKEKGEKERRGKEWRGWSLQNGGRNSSEECGWKKDKDRQKWKGLNIAKCNSNKQHEDRKNGVGCKRGREEGDDVETKVENPWKKRRNSLKYRNNKDGSKYRKNVELESSGEFNGNENEECKRKDEVRSLSPVKKNEAGTSGISLLKRYYGENNKKWKKYDNTSIQHLPPVVREDEPSTSGLSLSKKWTSDENRWMKNSTSVQYLPPVFRSDEPSTSGISLRFSLTDDDDNDDDDEEDTSSRGSIHEPWAISDIVETEDEEGEREIQGHCRGGLSRDVESDVSVCCDASVSCYDDSRERCDGDCDDGVNNYYPNKCEFAMGCSSNSSREECYQGRCDGELSDAECYDGDASGVVKSNGLECYQGRCDEELSDASGVVKSYGPECYQGRYDGELSDASDAECYDGDASGVVKSNGLNPDPDLVKIVIGQKGGQYETEKNRKEGDSCSPDESDCLASRQQGGKVKSVSIISHHNPLSVQPSRLKAKYNERNNSESNTSEGNDNDRNNSDNEIGEERMEESDEEEDEEEEEREEEERRGEEGSSQREGPRATQRLRPRSYRQFLLTRERRSRVFLKARSRELGRWFVTHFTHPYPSKDQKDQLASRTSMTRNQVSEWFGNMRRRIREATRRFNVCWEKRVRLYNSVITGKSEPLPILPDDAINTWEPPVSEEPSNSDQHEEVSASPKFKTTLLQRYLNNSYPDTQHSSPSCTPPPEENTPYLQHHHGEYKGEYSVFSPTPLNTSPREGFRALWNSSFENVKDKRVPGAEHRKVQRSRVMEEKGVRTYEKQRNQNGAPGYKKQGTVMWSEGHVPHGSSLLSSSQFLASSTGGVGREDWREKVCPMRFQTPSWASRSTLSGVRFTDEGGGISQGFRQPEELAAAYTLMQLQHM